MDSEAVLSIWLNMFDMLCKRTGLKLVPNQWLEAEAQHYSGRKVTPPPTGLASWLQGAPRRGESYRLVVV